MICPRLTTAFLSLLSLIAGTLCNADDAYPLREAVECHPRAGLPNIFAKIQAGETIKIAYLGGSITAASGWRIQSREWLAKTYPDADFEEIHAAIGGTGTDLGVFRLGNDVLRHKPDLLFVEFAVNDGGTKPEQIHKAMEGIVRQTWQANPATDICFVYTVSEPLLPDLKAGKMPRAASAMEELADHYAIPSIHFGVEIVRLLESEVLVFKAPKPADLATAKPMIFSSDGVHPHVETGHKLYTEAIARCWPAIEAAGGAAAPHEVGEPLRDDNWENAKQVPITAAMLKGEWKKLPADHDVAKWFTRNMPAVHQAQSAGSTLTFSFTGTTAAVFDIVGPDAGQIDIQVDEERVRTAKRFDPYCKSHRMSRIPLLTEGEPGHHKIIVTLSAEKLDKRSILFEQNRADYDANPDKYIPHTWMVGSLLIIGDLVE